MILRSLLIVAIHTYTQTYAYMCVYSKCCHTHLRLYPPTHKYTHRTHTHTYRHPPHTHTHIHTLTHTCVCAVSTRHTHTYGYAVQGGQDPQDTLTCRSLSAKEPLIIGLFCGKMTYKHKASCGSLPPCMGCLRLVGSLKL